ncbi:MAG: FtsW/RodA/SpoVE family cell cycle protein [Puniceicoccales bacterium]|jgi:rod shape determining protein RodA|nr:FtsW/RodA/SpoVE family cell cycle protein [Puniceicoccales bacterium]
MRYAKYKNLERDWINPACILALVPMGVMSIRSAQLFVHGNQWRGQLVWFALGSIGYLVCARWHYAFFLRYAHWIYLLGIFSLLMLWSPFGLRRYGALRWIGAFGLCVQPAEFAKFSTLIMLAGTLTGNKMGPIRESKSPLIRAFIIFAIPWFLVFLQPDLGSALIFPPILLAMLYISNLSSRFFLAIFTLGVLVLSAITWDIYRYRNFLDTNDISPGEHGGLYQKTSWLPLKDYQRNRIIGFIAPEVVDPHGTGISWNLRQSLISIGSGGFFGKGYGKGMQAQLGYLPKAVSTNDFLFSVLGEERGFLGTSTALLLLSVLIGNTFRIAGLAHDRFGRYLTVGIAVFFLMHVLINMGMTIGLMPITGVPLPFLSCGGSFLIVCCILQGIVQSVYRRRRNVDRDG